MCFEHSNKIRLNIKDYIKGFRKWIIGFVIVGIILVGMFGIPIALAIGTLDQSYDIANQSNWSTLVKGAVPFIPSVTDTVIQAKWALQRRSALTGNIWLRVETDNGSGTAPSGTQVGGNSDTIAGSALPLNPASSAWITFTWSSNYPSLTQGTKYWLIYDQNFDSPTNVDAGADYADGTYPNGSYCYWTTEWVQAPAQYNVVFEEYRTAAPPVAVPVKVPDLPLIWIK